MNIISILLQNRFSLSENQNITNSSLSCCNQYPEFQDGNLKTLFHSLVPEIVCWYDVSDLGQTLNHYHN